MAGYLAGHFVSVVWLYCIHFYAFTLIERHYRAVDELGLAQCVTRWGN